MDEFIFNFRVRTGLAEDQIITAVQQPLTVAFSVINMFGWS
jgi:hypothetical protein